MEKVKTLLERIDKREKVGQNELLEVYNETFKTRIKNCLDYVTQNLLIKRLREVFTKVKETNEVLKDLKEIIVEDKELLKNIVEDLKEVVEEIKPKRKRNARKPK